MPSRSSSPLMSAVLLLACIVGSASAEFVSQRNTRFHPSTSSTFKLVKLGNVNVTFLDETNLLGYDGQDMVSLGGYVVETRLGLIQQCNSANFDTVDGILGFGWANNTRTAALLKTLTSPDRLDWGITQPPGFVPMPRLFAFTASPEKGELQLGAVDPASYTGSIAYMPMVGNAYGANVTSIKYGTTELLNFARSDGQPLGREPTAAEASQPGAAPSPPLPPPAYIGDFDSGTTCLLLPNTTVNGTFLVPPYQVLYKQEMAGQKLPLVYTINGQQYSMDYSECVDAADSALILGDAWFRRYVVVHDLRDENQPVMGLGLQAPNYPVGAVEVDKPQLLQTNSKLSARRSLLDGTSPVAAVRKVPLVSQRHVTYNIDLSIGTPPQQLEVIFDTGSFMLAVFADPPPPGMVPTGLVQVSAEDVVGYGAYLGDDSTAAKLLLAVNAMLILGVIVAAVHVQSRRRQRNSESMLTTNRDVFYGTV